MMKPLFVLAGLVMVIFARPIVDACESLAFENADALSRRRTTLPAARAEGVVAVAIGLYGRWPAGVSKLFGFTGVTLVLAPRRTLDASIAIAYREPHRVETRGWVVPFTRLVGLVHLLFAFELHRCRRDDR